jgi:cell division protein FtsB
MSASAAVIRSSALDSRGSGRTVVHRVRVTPRAVCLGIVVLLLLSLMVSPLRSYVHERGELAGLQQSTVQLEAQNAALGRRVGELQDPAVLERLARQCLGLVRPGETAFITVPEHGAPTPPSC